MRNIQENPPKEKTTSITSQLELEDEFRTVIGQLESLEGFLFALSEGHCDISGGSGIFYVLRDIKDRTEGLFNTSRNIKLQLDEQQKE